MNTATHRGLRRENIISPRIVDHVMNPGTISKNLRSLSSLVIYDVKFFLDAFHKFSEELLPQIEPVQLA